MSFVSYPNVVPNSQLLTFNSLPLPVGQYWEDIKTIVEEVLAPLGQLVVLEVGQQLLQLEEEPLAGFVAVGEHVEGS